MMRSRAEGSVSPSPRRVVSSLPTGGKCHLNKAPAERNPPAKKSTLQSRGLKPMTCAMTAPFFSCSLFVRLSPDCMYTFWMDGRVSLDFRKTVALIGLSQTRRIDEIQLPTSWSSPCARRSPLARGMERAPLRLRMHYENGSDQPCPDSFLATARPLRGQPSIDANACISSTIALLNSSGSITSACRPKLRIHRMISSVPSRSNSTSRLLSFSLVSFWLACQVDSCT